MNKPWEELTEEERSERMRIASEGRRRMRQCVRKVKFETREAAWQKGMNVYKCPHCGMFHRASVTAKY